MSYFNLEFNRTLHKFSSPTTISTLCKFCKSEFRLERPEFSYIDEDSEKIIVDQQLELNEAVSYLILTNKHLKVSEQETPKSPVPTPNSPFSVYSEPYNEEKLDFQLRRSLKLSQIDIISSEIIKTSDEDFIPKSQFRSFNKVETKSSLLDEVHYLACRRCGFYPLRGTVYECVSCRDVFFCENCEQDCAHPHSLLKLRTPSPYSHPLIHKLIHELGFSDLTNVAQVLSECKYDYNEAVSRLLDL